MQKTMIIRTGRTPEKWIQIDKDNTPCKERKFYEWAKSTIYDENHKVVGGSTVLYGEQADWRDSGDAIYPVRRDARGNPHVLRTLEDALLYLELLREQLTSTK